MTGARHRRLLALAASTTVLSLGAPALAFDFALKLEPGLAIPLTDPQSQKFNLGGTGAIKGMFGVTRYLDITANMTFVGVPSTASAPSSDLGTAWATGAGLRLKRPHDAPSFLGISPWVEGDLLYVRTGGLDRFGYDVGAGVSFPLGAERTYWIGPFVRYLQIHQSDDAGFDNTDAKLLLLGVSLEIEARDVHMVKGTPTETIVAQCPPAVACAAAAVCPHDRDGDEVPDEIDNCPDVRGPASNYGCPVYEKIRIARDKLELDEKAFFGFDKDALEPQSFPILDEVVRVLKDNSSFQIRIEGNTDSVGSDAHNIPLAERRAASVLDYLVKHGIAKERLSSRSNGSSEPNETNKTELGRENNRRVEFFIVKRSAP